MSQDEHTSKNNCKSTNQESHVEALRSESTYRNKRFDWSVNE